MRSIIKWSLINLLVVFSTTESIQAQGYPAEFVDVFTNQPYRNDNFDYIVINRDQNRIKSKYFAENIKSVKSKFDLFAKDKNIVCYAAAGYLMGANYDQLENLTIENGYILNQNLSRDKFDALVIVYATGGVVVSDLRKGDLKLQGANAPSYLLDIRKNAFHRQAFYDWCRSESATVFQTHLLAFDNQFIMAPNADTNAKNASKRYRRFLIVGRDNNSKLKHIIINTRSEVGLRSGAEKCFDFAQKVLGIRISFMLNLDTGAQNVFNLFNSDGSVFKGFIDDESLPLDRAHNLLVYYSDK
jgi:hypothetical protein